VFTVAAGANYGDSLTETNALETPQTRITIPERLHRRLRENRERHAESGFSRTRTRLVQYLRLRASACSLAPVSAVNLEKEEDRRRGAHACAGPPTAAARSIRREEEEEEEAARGVDSGVG
jgi:hypothetical protein